MTSGLVGRMNDFLWRPVDVAALAAFRIIFGTLMCFASVRFLLSGWIEDFFVEPRFFFKYSFAPWVQPLPPWGMYALYLGMAVLALLVALGLFYRVAIVGFMLAFSYAELIDVTNYLNHYYLVVLLAFLLCFLPLHRAWSLDARRNPKLLVTTFPAWYGYVLRIQVGIVYFFAGMAKAQPDWLLHAQPLSIWLSSRIDLPVIGPILGQRWAWYAFSWAGFLFDTTIVLFLSWRRTRLPAYLVVLAFHTMTRVLFPIGMFPFIMTSSALIFFSPSWPRRVALWLTHRLPAAWRPRTLPTRLEAHGIPAAPSRWARRLLPLAAAYGALQLVMPLRTHLYGGNVLWHEQGMRFSWRVMVREKNGAITYIVHSPQANRTWHISPRRYLTQAQEREMSSQPDMILQLGKFIAHEYRQQGFADVEVRVDAWVSLNGRPGQRLIDPNANLDKLVDTLKPAWWILPAPTSKPPSLNPVS